MMIQQNRTYLVLKLINNQLENNDKNDNKCLINLKTYMTEEEKEGLYNAFDSDEELNDKPDKYIGEEAIFEYYNKFHKFSRDSQKCNKTPGKLYNVS